MLRKGIILAIVVLVVSGITIFSIASAEESLIPSWIKNTAQFWIDGQVSDSEFINALQFLIDKGILSVGETTQTQIDPPSLQLDAGPSDDSTEVSLDEPSQEIDLDYNPIIKPENFISKIDNKFLTFIPGTTFVYEAQTEDGLERIEVTVLDEKRMVMGVETTVVWDRVWLEGELIEDTKDWYAQDKEGNVWYFGEESIEYAGGESLGTPGSWEAGIDGAKPGIVMKASPKVGDFYRQEYYVGEAEDTGEVLSLRETVSVPHDRMYYCLKTKDLNPLEPNVVEFKYYCPVIGGVALEEDLEDKEVVELIDVGSDELMTDFPLEEAKKIALEVVPGKVTDVEREGFRGRIVYAIEIMPDNGNETDVFIDIKYGTVLGTET